MRKIAILTVFSLIFISCEKDVLLVMDNQQMIVENTGFPLIIKELSGGDTYKEYTYNDRNLLLEEKSKWFYTSYTYNGNNQLIESEYYVDMGLVSSNLSVLEEAGNREEWVNPDNTEKSLTKSLEYNDRDQMVTVNYIRPSVSHSEYSVFAIENERITKQLMYWKNELSHYIDYIYDERGNLIKESKYRVSSTGITELLTTTEYEYDGMHNPFQSFKRLLTPGINTNPNNIVKEIYTIHFEVDGIAGKVRIKENSYGYNDMGYPIRKNEVTYVYK